MWKRNISIGTEKIIGEVIRESGIPREEFFITTKVPYVNATDRYPRKLIESVIFDRRMTYMARATESLEASLGLFGLDYVDLVRAMLVANDRLILIPTTRF